LFRHWKIHPLEDRKPSPLFQEAQAMPYSMIAADLNRDRRPDVVVARSDALSFLMFNRPPKK